MALTLNDIQAGFHSIKISDGTDTLAVAADGSIAVTDNGGSLTVDASDLDIRDLSSATDSVAAVQSGTWDIGTVTAVTSITNDVNIADGGNSITVDASDLDIRDLTHVSDSVKIGDGTDLLAVNADGSINVQGSLTTVPGGFDTWKVTDQDVTNTASQLASTALTGRIYLEVQNVGNVDAFVNFSNAVSATNGLKIPKGSSWAIDLDDNAAIWAITSAGTADLRIAEYAF
jgi:hypothetical protein